MKIVYGGWKKEFNGNGNGSVKYGGTVDLYGAESHGGSKSIHSGWMKRVWHQKKRSFII